jgi:hypothetical protein
MTLTQEQIEEMTIKIALKINHHDKIVNSLKLISARIGLVAAIDPKDQFGDIIPKSEIDKHSLKAKTEYDKIFPPATTK